MTEDVTLAPPNALIFLSDSSGGTAPEFVEDMLVLSTDTVISVGCRADVDGETTIRLGSASDVRVANAPAFDGMLKTPTRKLVVSTVEEEAVLGMAVASDITRVRIWTNRSKEPDEIVIGLGD